MGDDRQETCREMATWLLIFRMERGRRKGRREKREKVREWMDE